MCVLWVGGAFRRPPCVALVDAACVRRDSQEGQRSVLPSLFSCGWALAAQLKSLGASIALVTGRSRPRFPLLRRARALFESPQAP